MKPVDKGLDFQAEAKLHFLQDLSLSGNVLSSSFGCGSVLEGTTVPNGIIAYVKATKYSSKVLTVG